MQKTNDKFLKRIVLFIMMLTMLAAVAAVAVVNIEAEAYYTVRVDYKYDDGSNAHDSYVAVYPAGEDVDVTVTNPSIPGFKPVTSQGGEEEALTTTLRYNKLSSNETVTIYYVPDLVHYRVRYFFQNIRDDLYTENLGLDNSYYEHYGYTGEYPDALEDISFEGFTNLFHEPDFIAADESTIFKLYYDRNYVLISFDLDGGHGVEPIYAKYGSTFNIAQPKRAGYTFLGWAPTNHEGEFIDADGNIISEEEALAALNEESKFTTGVVPGEDVYYKAMWYADTTTYRVVYLFENPDDDGYSVIASKSAEATSGELIDPADTDSFYDPIKNMAFNTDDDRKKADKALHDYYNTDGNIMSEAEAKQLYNYNCFEFSPGISRMMSADNFIDLSTGKVMVHGDGTTRIYACYKRKVYTQRFFYLRENMDETDQSKRFEVAGYTKAFSQRDVDGVGLDRHLKINSGSQKRSHWRPIVDISDPAEIIRDKYKDKLTFGTYPEEGRYIKDSRYKTNTFGETYDNTGEHNYRYYYYQVETKYGENMYQKGDWLLDVFEPVPLNDGSGQYTLFGAWSVEAEAKYQHAVDNRTCKGIYQVLDEDLMRVYPQDGTADYSTTLNYLAFWTNTKNKDWNTGEDLYHLNYENYVQVLPEDIPAEGEPLPDDMYFDNGIYYRLDHTVTSYDGIGQCDEKNIKENQTATSLDGFTKPQPKLGESRIKVDFTGVKDEYGYNIINVKYLYLRNTYSLTFFNGNHPDVMDGVLQEFSGIPYQQSILDKEYVPEYFDPDLKDYYRFDGWFHSPIYRVEFNFDRHTMPAEDFRLYAKWVPVSEEVKFYNDYKKYTRDEELHSCSVLYDEKILTKDIPADDADAAIRLTKPSPKAEFAGWYYINEERRPVRFDPENMPVTSELHLYAEWISTDTAKYRVRYVEQGTDTEVAPSSTGTLFVSKTKTFTAKSGSQLNATHAWSSTGSNWWPIISSHSVLIEPNKAGDEYAPNEYDFEYVRKNKVWYQVQYINAVTGQPMSTDENGDAIVKIVESSNAVVTEKSEYHEGFIADRVTKSAVLSASAESDPVKAKAEELEHNKIIFYYNTNDNAALYQVDHYIQSLDHPDEYSLYLNETLAGTIGETVMMSHLYNDEIASSLTTSGYEVNESKTTIDGLPAGDSMVIDETLKTVKIYYDRDWYNYVVKYVDYEQARRHNYDSTLWDGVLETVFSASPRPVGEEEYITVPTTYEYTSVDPDTGEEVTTAYHRISDRQITLTIRPDDLDNPTVNVIEVFYKKDSQRLLRYRAVCTTETDEEFGLLTQSGELVESEEEITGCTANRNPAYGGRYIFRGWFDNPDGVGEPLSTENKYVPSFPGADMTYYAVFEQVQVSMLVDIMYRDIPVGAKGRSSSIGTIDPDGEVTGSYIYFEDPYQYENGTATPYDDTKMFDFSVKPKDNKIYKYKFEGWYEEDLSDGHIIEHLDKPTTEVKEHMDKDYRYIAMFTKDTKSELDYEIHYVFDTRTHGEQDFVVKGTLNAESTPTLEEATTQDAAAYELTDEFIMARAPYESNHGKRLTWSDDPRYVVKTSEKGDGETTRDRMIVTIKAVQTDQPVVVNYRTNPDDTYKAVDGYIGDNYELNEKLLAIKADDTYKDRAFSHWEVRKSASDKAPVIAKSYDSLFDLCLMDNYWITPVYGGPGDKTVTLNVAEVADGKEDWFAYTWEDGVDGELVRPVHGLTFRDLSENVIFVRVNKGEAPTLGDSNELSGYLNKTDVIVVTDGATYKLTELSGVTMSGDYTEDTDATPAVTLTQLDYSRNRWTDEDGNISPSGETDLLYVDFEIAFEDGENRIYLSDDCNVGVVFELCSTEFVEDFDPNKDYGYKSDPAKLKNALKNAVSKGVKAGKYNYDPGDPNSKRQIQLSNIPSGQLTNHDRVNFARSYPNEYITVAGSDAITYTNSQYLMKATAYIIKDGTVTLSNFKYICLKDIAAKNSVVDPGYNCDPVDSAPADED